MTSTSSSGESERLDFEQAMSDFSTMFPTLSRTTIEETLRRNKGAVDDTVDQLLVLTMDNVGLDDGQGTSRGSQPSSDPPPPSYESAMSNTVPALAFDDPFSLGVLDEVARDRAIVKQASDARCPAQAGVGNMAFDAQHYDSQYHPPLVGPLPDDFLRVEQSAAGTSSKDYTRDVVASSMDYMYDDLDAERRRNHLQQHRHGHQQQQAAQFAQLGIFSTAPRRPPPPRRRPSPVVPQAVKRQAAALKVQMIENQFQRTVATDAELIKYLDDEKIAIMSQDKEFMKVLRNDRDFLACLERDTSAHAKSLPWSSSRARSSRKDRGPSVPDGPTVTTAPRQANADRPPVPQGPAFDTMPAEATVDFSHRVANMSKSSKNKFALLARKFARKQRGAGGILGGDTSDFSQTALIDDDVESPNVGAPRHITSAGYDQEGAISGHGDLHEGSLFSR